MNEVIPSGGHPSERSFELVCWSDWLLPPPHQQAPSQVVTECKVMSFTEPVRYQYGAITEEGHSYLRVRIGHVLCT